MRFYISFRAITQGKSRKIKNFQLIQPTFNSTIRAHIIENYPVFRQEHIRKAIRANERYWQRSEKCLLAKIGRHTLLEVHLEFKTITVLLARLKRQVRVIAF